MAPDTAIHSTVFVLVAASVSLLSLRDDMRPYWRSSLLAAASGACALELAWVAHQIVVSATALGWGSAALFLILSVSSLLLSGHAAELTTRTFDQKSRRDRLLWEWSFSFGLAAGAFLYIHGVPFYALMSLAIGLLLVVCWPSSEPAIR